MEHLPINEFQNYLIRTPNSTISSPYSIRPLSKSYKECKKQVPLDDSYYQMENVALASKIGVLYKSWECFGGCFVERVRETDEIAAC
jgi:hypothetical protein